MREWVFVFLYGALVMAGLFLSLFWSEVASRRARRIRHKWVKRSDRYWVLAAAIAVISAGSTVLFSFRLAGNLTFGISPMLHSNWNGVGVAAGLVIILLGKSMMVWLADLEKQPPVWTWSRWLVGATMLWGVAAIFVSAAIPLWRL